MPILIIYGFESTPSKIETISLASNAMWGTQRPIKCSKSASCRNGIMIIHNVNSDAFIRVTTTSEKKIYRIFSNPHQMKTRISMQIDDDFIGFIKHKYSNPKGSIFEVYVNGIVLKSSKHNSPFRSSTNQRITYIVTKNVHQNSTYNVLYDDALPLYQFYPDTDFLTPKQRYIVLGALVLWANGYSFINQYPYKSDLCYYEYILKNSNQDYHDCYPYRCINLCTNVTIPLDLKTNTITKIRISVVGSRVSTEKKYDYKENHAWSSFIGHRMEIRNGYVSLVKYAGVSCDKSSLTPYDYNGRKITFLRITNPNPTCVARNFKGSGNFVYEFELEHFGTNKYMIKLTHKEFHYDYIEGDIGAHIFFSTEHHFQSTNSSERTIRNGKETMCQLLISTNAKINFVPAKCGVFGTKCLNRCDGSFDIINLNPGINYFVRIVALGYFSDEIIEQPISLKDSLRFKLKFEINEDITQLIFRFDGHWNDASYTIGSRCLIVIREISTESNWKYYQICEDQIYCVVPCNTILFRHTSETDYLIYSIKVLNIMSNFIDYQPIMYQKTIVSRSISKNVSINFEESKFIVKTDNIETIMNNSELEYIKECFKREFPFDKFIDSDFAKNVQMTKKNMIIYHHNSEVANLQNTEGFMKNGDDTENLEQHLQKPDHIPEINNKKPTINVVDDITSHI